MSGLKVSKVVEWIAAESACDNAMALATRGKTKVRFFDPNKIEDELRRYCIRVRSELANKKAERRKKLEAPPPALVDIPTYWEAILEQIDLKALGQNQFSRLVQDLAGNIFVAHPPGASSLDPINTTGRPVWLRTSGQKVVRKSEGVRLLVDAVEIGPFETTADPSNDLGRLANEARSLFRDDVIGRARVLLGHLGSAAGYEPLTGLSIELLRNRLLEDGLAVAIPRDHGRKATWKFDQEIESLCRDGVSLTEAIGRVGNDRIDRGFEEDGSSESGVSRTERCKDLKREFQKRRSQRLGRSRGPLETGIRKAAAVLTVSHQVDEILKEMYWSKREELGVMAARRYIELTKEADLRTISQSPSEDDIERYVGKSIDLANAENRLARFSAVDDCAILFAFRWEPAWLETMWSEQPADIEAAIGAIVASAGWYKQQKAA